MSKNQYILHDSILNWYAKNGRKNLPWQLDNTPYHTWISEIMLQQTQVSTVIKRYEQFVKKWPNIQVLSLADIDDVLSIWSGLGYYARARNLHKTAAIIHEAHKNQLPNSLEQLILLPGIGKTTANAILSLGFNQPATILDGNIKRTISRIFAINTPINQNSTEKKLWELAEQINKNTHPKFYNQAMMDIGSLICKPQVPLCHQCPVLSHCKSFKEKLTEKIPTRIKTKKNQKQSHLLFMCSKDSKILLSRRPSKGIWGGLHCPPIFENTHAMKTWCQKYQISFQKIQKSHTLKHHLTHKIWYITVYALKIIDTQISQPDNHQWLSIKNLNKGLPKPILEIINTFNDENSLLPKTQKNSNSP